MDWDCEFLTNKFIMKIKIAASILSADFGKLNEEIASIDDFVDLIHFDVMDGSFVPQITVGARVLKWLKSKHPFDVHLMIRSPENFVKEFADAGAGTLTVHAEACDDLESVLRAIKGVGVRAGVSISPNSSLKKIEHVLDLIDQVLVMTVEPGFGGQKFMPEMMEKVRELRAMKPDLDIEVDGGINAETARVAIEAGANILVAGSYIFGAKDRGEAVSKLRG